MFSELKQAVLSWEICYLSLAHLPFRPGGSHTLLEGKREKMQYLRGLCDGWDACWGAQTGVTLLYTLVLVVARMNI